MEISGNHTEVRAPNLLNVERARHAAQLFEESFLSEMLAHSGLGKMPDAFGGGEGESQFSSLLIREYARLMTEAGGIGLQEAVMRTMIAEGGEGESS